MRVTTFYSYKGGLGRTLLLSWAAKSLAADGRSVVALDLDLEAPGLSFKFGVDGGPGVVDLLRGFLRGDPPPEGLSEWLQPVEGAERLWLLPAGEAPGPAYWRGLAGVSWEALFFGADPQGVRFFTWLREAIERAVNPDHLLIDARTGVTELGGAALSLMADQVLALLGTSEEGVVGTREVLRAVMASPRPPGQEPPRIALALARMPAAMGTPDLQRLRRAVQGRIQQEADPLTATVEVPLPLVVRSEPRLQEDERRALGGERLRVHEDYEAVLAWVQGADVPGESPGVVAPEAEGLAGLEASIAIQRQAAAESPDYEADLASSLLNLGTELESVGRWEEALRATREAVGLRRTLAGERPDQYRPELARALNTLGNLLSRLGRREAALEATREAVTIQRSLASDEPGRFLPGLADMLNNLGVDLSKLGRRDEALEAAVEAVEAHRGLTIARPNEFLPRLARSLGNLGVRLWSHGRLDEALDATREAVEITRGLAGSHTDAFTPELGAALNNLGVLLDDLGRREQALEAAVEAVATYRQLAAGRPEAFLPDLARSLWGLGAALGDGGGGERVGVFREGLKIIAPLAERSPKTFHGLAGGLLREYVGAASAAGVVPDEALVTRVRRALADESG